MASNARSGIGVVIKRGDGASVEAFTTIAEVNGIVNMTRTRGIAEVTTLDSPNGYREFISAFRSGGTFTLNMNWTRDGYEGMVVDYESDDAVNYRIIIPDAGATQYDFAALITDLGGPDSTTHDAPISMTAAFH